MKMLQLILLLLAVSSAATKPRAIECVVGCGDAATGPDAKSTPLIEPFGVAFDKAGNGYVCEYKGQRITRWDRNGIAVLFAGIGKIGYSGDDGPARNAEFNDPHGLVISRDQRMYVADTRNNCIRMIDLRTGIITTVAGTREAGYSGDGGAASEAKFNGIYAIDINREGDRIYAADLHNRRIRLVNLRTGIVTTIAGNGEKGIPHDGADPARNPLVDPRAVAVDSKGNVYILERSGNALRVIAKDGKVRTVIGPANSANPPNSGGRIEKELNGPKHLCVDEKDNVIIADAENHLIRKYTPADGRTVVIAGTGEKGSRLVSDDPLRTQLNRPHGVYVHSSGAIYISDSYNHRVLRLR